MVRKKRKKKKKKLLTVKTRHNCLHPYLFPTLNTTGDKKPQAADTSLVFSIKQMKKMESK